MNIFLSASIPFPERDAKYFETADIIAIRDAVIALTAVILPRYRLIWGGHPSITPLIYYVINKLEGNIQEHVLLYQSSWFQDSFPEDNSKFNNIIYTEKLADLQSSIRHMRHRMFDENEYAAAVFIGGMEGVEEEYRMFAEYHPDAYLFPIASTGAAAKVVYDNLLPEKYKSKKLERDYGYMSMIETQLLNKL